MPLGVARGGQFLFSLNGAALGLLHEIFRSRRVYFKTPQLILSLLGLVSCCLHVLGGTISLLKRGVVRALQFEELELGLLLGGLEGVSFRLRGDQRLLGALQAGPRVVEFRRQALDVLQSFCTSLPQALLLVVTFGLRHPHLFLGRHDLAPRRVELFPEVVGNRVGLLQSL